MKTLVEKANWLNDNYGPYGVEWYLKDAKRLEAIYDREIAKRHAQSVSELLKVQLKEQEERANHVEEVYFKFYHCSFKQEMAENRRIANERLQAIRKEIF